MKHARGWLLLAIAVVALPWLWQFLTLPPAATLLQQARFGPTVDDSQARPVALPHAWQADCADCRTAWYQFDIPLAQPPSEAKAVYLAGVGENAAVYLNGRLLGSGGRFTDPAARLGPRGLLLPAPVSLWTTGTNRLYVLVKAERPRDGRMPALALADESVLLPLERWRSLLAVTLPQVLATAAAMLGVVMGVLWFYRRQQPEYALLASAALAWALSAFSALVLEPPWPAPWWDAWLLFSLALAAATWLGLAVCLAGGRAPGPRQAALALVAAALGALAAWPADGAALGPMRALLMLVWAAAGAVLVRAGWQRRDGPLWLAGAMLALLASWQALAPALPEVWQTLAASTLAAAWALGTAGWLLLLRFVQTLNAVELLNIDLETLVQARTAELQAQFERVRELERRQTIAEERERLMRDMHDGVGGHLVSVLAMIEADRRRPAELAEVVRQALDDMRLLVDSLEPVDDDLNAVLAMWHDRLAPRLRAAGVALHWDVHLLPAVPGLSPARVLHVLRILQEAVSNALRHGRARTLTLSAQAGDGGVRISLQDDGQGFDTGASPTGRGLKNMRRRAQEVGAGFDIQSMPGQGARACLWIPLPAAGAAPAAP